MKNDQIKVGAIVSFIDYNNKIRWGYIHDVNEKNGNFGISPFDSKSFQNEPATAGSSIWFSPNEIGTVWRFEDAK
jgi:hypothetical protein